MKQTEIGLIPDDWEVKKLGETNHVETGSTPPTEDKSNYGNEYLFVSPLDLGINKYILKTEKKLSKKGFSLCRSFPKGSILYTCIGSTIGKCGIANKELTSNQQINAVFPNDNIDNEFLYYAVQNRTEDIRNRAGQQAVPLINKSEFEETLYSLPPLTEQQRIAKALSDVDTLISTTEKLIQKKKNIKQGAMQNLLTGKKRLPSFGPQTKSPTYKQTELGLIPEDWEVKGLNELINDISDGPFGSNLKTEHYTTEREVRIIQLSNVGEDGWDNENVKYTTFTHAQEIKRCIVPYGSIVIAKMMPAGRAILCPNQEKMYILGSDCVRITPNSLLKSLYFIYFTKTSFYLNQIKENTQGSTRARTSVSKLKRIEIALPSKEEQTAIANVLSCMDKEIETLNTKLEKYRNLKTAMMQQLLTGKIRLIK